MERVSRAEAKKSGLKRYFTGQSCKFGHVSERITSSAVCFICNGLKRKRQYDDNIEKEREKSRNYRKNNKEKTRRTWERWKNSNSDYYENYYKNNKTKLNYQGKLWREANKEASLLYARIYRDNNRGRYRALWAKRRAAKLNATPAWSEFEEIKQFYANCPEGYHVDHIVPLQGKNVCGLHVLANLQYLLASENISKGNKF